MEDLNIYTPTQLLKMINEMKSNHDQLKQEIINFTYEIDELENKINEKIIILDQFEKNYIELIEELNNR